jgi:hypothetical protein
MILMHHFGDGKLAVAQPRNRTETLLTVQASEPPDWQPTAGYSLEVEHEEVSRTAPGVRYCARYSVTALTRSILPPNSYG